MNIFSKNKAFTALKKGIINFGLVLVLLFSPLVPSTINIAQAIVTDPADAGDFGFVPPVDTGDDGNTTTTPPVDEGDDGVDDFVPPVDTGDDGNISTDLRAPEVSYIFLPTREIGRIRTHFNSIQFIVAFDEEMATSSAPVISFDPAEVGETFDFTKGYWNEDATKYTFEGNILDTGISIKDIDVIVSGATDVAGNEQEVRVFADLISIDLFVPPVDEGDDGVDDFVPPVDTGDDGNATTTPPVDEGDDGVATTTPPVDTGDDGVATTTPDTNVDPDPDFTPPVDEGDDGVDDFVPPVDTGDDGVATTTPPVDTGDDGNATTTPPVDEGDDGNVPTQDTRSPQVLDISVSHDLIADANQGRVFSVTVLFDEDMDINSTPVVSFIPNNAAVTETLSFIQGVWNSATEYVVTYSMRDVDVEVADVDVRVEGGVDVAGNVLESKLVLDLFSIDTLNPTVVIGFDPEKTTYTGEDTVVVSAVFSEPVTDPSISVHTEGGLFSLATTTMQATNDTRAWTFTWDIPGNVLANGDAVLTIFARDLAENWSVRNDQIISILNEEVVEVDTVAPSVVSVEISDDVISEADRGTFVAVTVTYDEVMNTNVTPEYGFAEELDSTTLIATGTPAWSQNGTVFAQLYEVQDADIVELKDIGFVIGGAEDVSGNAQNGYFAEGLVAFVDTVAPTGTITVTPNHTLVGDTQAVFSFVASEKLATAPEIYIFESDVVAVPMTPSETQDRTWHFFWAVPNVDAEYTVIISGVDDISENQFEQRAEITTVVSDNVEAPPAPEITNIEVNNSLINEADTGTDFIISTTFSESLNASVHPQVSFVGDDVAGTINTLNFADGFWNDDYTTYFTAYSVVDVNVTTKDISVRVDASGSREVEGTPFAFNTSSTSQALFDIDTEAPAVGFSYNPSQNPVAPGSNVSVTVTFSEDVFVSPQPEVRWSGADAGSSLLTPVTEGGRDVWEFDWNVPANATTGTVTFIVDAKDSANNDVGSHTRNTRTIDAETPRVVSVTPSDAVISESDAGSTVALNIAFNKTMNVNIAPTIVLSPNTITGGTFTTPVGEWVDATTYRVTYDVLDADVSGGVSVKVMDAEDLGGHVITDYFAVDVLTVDTIAPLPVLTYDPNRTLTGGDTLTITANFNEVVVDPAISIETPAGVVVGTQQMTRVSDTVWSFEWNVPQGAEHNGNDAVEITVHAEDAVGNTNIETQNNTRTILNSGRDGQAPRITSVSISDTEINEGDANQEFTVRVTFDEEMNTGVEPTITFGQSTGGTLVRTGSGLWEKVDSTDNASFTATYTIVDTDAEIRSAVNRTPIAVTVSGGSDLFGNPAENTVIKANAFGIDMRSPGVVFSYAAITGDNPNWPTVVPGNVVRITATFDEDLEEAPQIHMNTNPIVAVISNITMTPTSDARVWTYDWTVPGLQSFGQTEARFHVSARDIYYNNVDTMQNQTRTVAENGGGNGGGGGTTDATAPEVVSVTPSDTVISESDAGVDFTLTIRFNEAMDGGVIPSVALSPSVNALTEVSRVWNSSTELVVTYSTTDTDFELHEGIDVTVLGGQDTSGNTHDTTAFTDVFSVDLLAPSGSLAFNPDKVTYTGNDTVAISVTMSEDVATPKITVETNQGAVVEANMSRVSNTVWQYEWNVPGGVAHNGDIKVTVSATDIAGNINTVAATDTSHKIFNEAGTTDPDPEPEPEPPSGGGGGGGAVYASGLAPAYPNPLAILDFKARRVSESAILVTWRTNLPATTQVFYGIESVPKLLWENHFGYNFETVEDVVLKDSHSVLLTNVPTGTTYYVRAESHLEGNFDVYSPEQSVGDFEITLDDLEINGAQCEYLIDFMGIHRTNTATEVVKLQTFLNQFMGAGLAVDGVFDIATQDAVKTFQTMYRDEILDPWGITAPTGFVYITTKKQINEIVCDTVLSLSSSERAEIDAYRVRSELQVGGSGVRPAPVTTPADVIEVETSPAETFKLPEYEDTEILVVPEGDGAEIKLILPGTVFFGIPAKLRIW